MKAERGIHPSAADRTAGTADSGAASPPKASPAELDASGPNFARINLDAALQYARENPDDVRGQVYRFDTVSRNHPGTPSAERAAKEAKRLRAGRPELFANEVTVKPFKLPELDKRRYDCPRRTGPVTVDGRLDDWKQLPQECRDPPQILFEAKSWEGPRDCSYRFAVEYDDEYLYVAVETTDDCFYRKSPEAHPWQQDGIEIRLDARGEQQRSYGRGRRDFAGHILVALSSSETPEEVYAFQKENWYAGMRAVCVKTAKGHNTEVAIPVAYLDAHARGRWREFRLNIAVDDFDPLPDGDAVGAQLWWQPDWRLDENVAGSGTFRRR